ncbi:MAG: GntR family transcriptional regulator [Pseudomonadota bacterium]|nr:GntR family transcriptional regulator [Pseudomonadota bacterium]
MPADTTKSQDVNLRVETLPGLREQVAERLRMAIVVGHFKPGERLIERELCDMMGVSRTSLREALRELQADGIITLKPNKGMSVSVLTQETARSIYEVRQMLEGLAARLFARNATTQQMADLRASVEDLALVYQDFSAEAFIEVKGRFYDILLAGAGNEVAADMLRRIHTRASQLRVVSLSRSERAQASIRELRAFCDALEARNEDLAWELCLDHVQKAAQAALNEIPEVSSKDA